MNLVFVFVLSTIRTEIDFRFRFRFRFGGSHKDQPQDIPPDTIGQGKHLGTFLHQLLLDGNMGSRT